MRQASSIINSLGYSFPARWLCLVQSTYEITEEIHGKANKYCRAEREAGSSVAGHGRGCNNFHGGRGARSGGKSANGWRRGPEGDEPPCEAARPPPPAR